MPLRLVYGTGVALACWVAAWGLIAPTQIDRAVPWILPPLHARFVGALYLSGAVCLIGVVLTRRWSRQAVVVPMIAIWTGVLLVVLLYRFDSVVPVWSTVAVWLVAYVVLPVTTTLHAWRHRTEARSGPGPEVPGWLRGVLWTQGVLVAVVSAAMLVWPTGVAAGWPWPAPDLAIQIYAGPLLAFGVGSVLAARRVALADVGILLAALAVFSVTVLAVSAAHADTFDAGPATWLWFAAFAAGSVLYGWLGPRALRSGRPVR